MWRIYNYCEENGLDSGVREYRHVKSTLLTMLGSGILEEEANLFFLAPDKGMHGTR